jgi:hypothetical protein
MINDEGPRPIIRWRWNHGTPVTPHTAVADGLLAGKKGKALEERFGSLLAAQKIYRASGHVINPCRFFDSNEAALADMKRLAKA